MLADLNSGKDQIYIEYSVYGTFNILKPTGHVMQQQV